MEATGLHPGPVELKPSSASETPKSSSVPLAAATGSSAQRQRAGLVLMVMCAGMFLVLLDVTVVNVAVPSITAGLRTSTAGVQWVVDAYTVTLASLLLAGGAAGDRLGHRRVVAAGLTIFGAASAGCALAPTPGLLVAARAAQGVGAALLLPGSIAAIADAYPDRAAQAKALGVWAAVSSLALPAGPLLGGLIVSTAGWRSVFWINPPVVAVCLVGVLAWVPGPGRRPGSRRSGSRRKGGGRPDGRRLDLAGVALATLCLAATVYAVIAASGSAVAAVAAAGIAVLAAVGLIVTERRVADPLLPPALFTRPAFRAVTISALIMNLTSNGLLFLLTRYLQSILGHRPLTAGLMLLPLFAPLAVMSPLAGRLTARYGPRPVMLAGAGIAAAGQLCLLLVTPAAGYPRLVPALLGVGLGVGLFTAPVVAAAMRAVPADRSGLASGINNTARQAGTALGVAVFGAAAGSPANALHFIGAVRWLGVAAATGWLIVAALIYSVAREPGSGR
jgi:MFS transporter, DHA2 family, methylenomycin A resistance protein